MDFSSWSLLWGPSRLELIALLISAVTYIILVRGIVARLVSPVHSSY